MDLKEIKDQYIEKLKEVWQKISESETAIRLMERYRSLSPTMQKVVLTTLIIVVVYIVYSLPAAYVTASVDYETSFQNNRQLIRGLFRTARQPTINASRFTGLSDREIQDKMSGFYANDMIVDSQKGAMVPTKNAIPASKIPSAIKQNSTIFELKRLNLKQVVTLSEQISTLHPNTKLAGVEIRADDKDPHYFNVKYTVSSLSLPMKQEPVAPLTNSKDKKAPTKTETEVE